MKQMFKVRCVIVDDEVLAQQMLEICIASDAELELVGKVSDADSAVGLIEATRPDLLFLDVQMPEISGLELLEVLRSEGLNIPAIIFVTAYDKYAINAFEESAVDYLLKPFDEKRFQKAVTSAKKRLKADRQEGKPLSADPVFRSLQNQRVPIRSAAGRIYFVRVKDIDWIEADGNYLRLHVGEQVHPLRETMHALEVRLKGLPFIRIHRSTIVNIDRVKEVEPWFTGEYIIYLDSGKELTLTRTYRDRFFDAAGKPSEK